MTYTKIAKLTKSSISKLLKQAEEWDWAHKYDSTTDYWSVSNLDLRDLELVPQLSKIWDRSRWARALAVKLEPEGYLHPHAHAGDTKLTKNHIVLATNDDCMSSNGEKEEHLDLGGVYWMRPQLKHESFNRGDTDRIHLIMEIWN